MIPEWLIDDTADIGEARIFAVHTQTPRLIGELVPDTEIGADEFSDDIRGLTISANRWTLCRIDWIDQPSADLTNLSDTLMAAVDLHDAVRNIGGTDG